MINDNKLGPIGHSKQQNNVTAAYSLNEQIQSYTLCPKNSENYPKESYNKTKQMSSLAFCNPVTNTQIQTLWKTFCLLPKQTRS